MSEPLPLPQLLDARHLAAELGVTRAAAEAIMRQLPTVQIPGLRKSYVRRDQVLELLERSTYATDQVVPASGQREERVTEPTAPARRGW